MLHGCDRLHSIERVHPRLAHRANGILKGPATPGPFIISGPVLA
jgi:hypothetical protein